MQSRKSPLESISAIEVPRIDHLPSQSRAGFQQSPKHTALGLAQKCIRQRGQPNPRRVRAKMALRVLCRMRAIASPSASAQYQHADLPGFTQENCKRLRLVGATSEPEAQQYVEFSLLQTSAYQRVALQKLAPPVHLGPHGTCPVELIVRTQQ